MTHHHRHHHHLRDHHAHHHDDSVAQKAAHADTLRIEKNVARYAGNWNADVQQAVIKAEQDIGLHHGYVHALLRAENPEGDSNATGMSHATRHHKRHAVSHGLLQLTPETMMVVAERHHDFLAAHGFPHVDESMIHNTQLNAYIGGLLFKDLGAQKDPARAYLRYVSPKMATAIFNAEQNGDTSMTAAQLAAQNGIPAAVVLNNPAVFGPSDNKHPHWTITHVLQHNLDKFSGVMPSALVAADTPVQPAAQNAPIPDTAQAASAALESYKGNGRHHHHHREAMPTATADLSTPQTDSTVQTGLVTIGTQGVSAITPSAPIPGI